MRTLGPLVAVGLVLTLHSTAHAQACTGSASFSKGPVRLGASLATAKETKSYGADLSVGASTGPFASASIARATYDGVDDAAIGFNTGVGYAIDINAKKTVQFCPLVGVSYVSGPDISVGTATISPSSRSFALGGSFGGIVTASPNFDLVPFVGASFVASRFSAKTNSNTFHTNANSGAITVGAGFVFNKLVTVRPSVSVPVGVEGATSTFQLGVAFNFGSSR